jgi:hypothetical protein
MTNGMGLVKNVPSSSLGESGRLDQWGVDPRLGKRFRSYAAHGGLEAMLKDVNEVQDYESLRE